MPSVMMSHIRTDKDRVELFHTMVNMINKTIKDASRTDYIVLNIIKQLNKEDIIYDGRYYSFEKFISKLEQDTRKGFFNAKIRDDDQLKTFLVKLMAAIRNIIGKKEVTKELERFLDTEHGYDICNKLSVNLLNFLINYRYYDGFDTLQFLDIIYPELAQEIQRKKIADPPQILNAVREGGPKQGPPRRPDPPAAQSGGRRSTRSAKKYPFGAKSRRNRTRKH
jgi:hypothetical protein